MKRLLMDFANNTLGRTQMKAVKGGYGGEDPTLRCFDENGVELGSGSLPTCDCYGFLNYCKIDLGFTNTTNATCT